MGGMCLYYSALQYLNGSAEGAELLRLQCAVYLVLNKDELLDHCLKQRWKGSICNNYNQYLLDTLYRKDLGDLMSMEVISHQWT